MRGQLRYPLKKGYILSTIHIEIHYILCTAPNAKRVFAEISALFSSDCLFSWLVAVLWWTLHKGTADADKIFSTLIPTTGRFMIFSPSRDPNNHTSTQYSTVQTVYTQYSTVLVRYKISKDCKQLIKKVIFTQNEREDINF